MKPLWEPSLSYKNQTNLVSFINFINKEQDLSISKYSDLYKWSISEIEIFQESIWNFFKPIHSQKYNKVLKTDENLIKTKWFDGAKLNFAENMLKYRDDHIAIIFRSETGITRYLTYTELYEQTSKVSFKLKEIGVGVGDCVAGFLPNIPETVIAMLATTSLGAIWSSCSPDFGFQGIIDRFGQIEPKVLFTTDNYSYNGKIFDSLSKAFKLKKEITSLKNVIVIPFLEEAKKRNLEKDTIFWPDILDLDLESKIDFAQLPFNHPLYILYSSGTTGPPKCMVHGAGNVLLQHLKELGLQTDIKRKDRIFYFTTCGWMMWNWLISSLLLGASIVLYDGSPFYPNPDILWKYAEDEKITVFGTSARYIAAIENEKLEPSKKYNLNNLKIILSTGSPLSAESFDYVYEKIKKDVCLSSISGGSDLVGCFAGGSPISPVYKGQIQVRNLGMAIEAWDETGEAVFETKGELICKKPWPSMPIMFWNDPDNSKYLKAYFSIYPNIWHHGDFCEITAEEGVIVYGRSDTTLNPGGVRIGTAEIYRQVEKFEEIADSLVVGQNWQNDVRIILFIKLNVNVIWNEDFIYKIKKTIRANCSPRHVPNKILRIDDIPYTISGKKVELAVRDILHGKTVKNKDALANPQSLKLYENLKI